MAFDTPIKLLVVDDYEDILIESKDFFERSGFEVFIAGDANKAWEIFVSHKPQICLIDVIIPTAHTYGYLIYERGLALIRKIKEIYPKTKCVAFASADTNVLYLAKEFGADDVVQKPSVPRVILDKLNVIALESALQDEQVF